MITTTEMYHSQKFNYFFTDAGRRIVSGKILSSTAKIGQPKTSVCPKQPDIFTVVV